ncbi:putative bifunctional diguanylate cyclase/phosphodiesterase [Pseudomonas rhizoryzae]|uniref:putative bifunctional diguanylate cyclase/phosphodiesterase n=1 Tax=Pseudomonas rhizoryzae TaxID=2571129 RepID=UPI0007379C16|nr:EAL domain-containing protein [Pseudomonas rhizoryzae]KTT29220.1 diguanylate cyclase [Pseudomonas psychrotolerans]KTT30966.1 diguanylate cyclase [Pseudomonas psychrotolerans]KTT72152.1 diguanylate cyclase [Pseudomonas psychrotolerans]
MKLIHSFQTRIAGSLFLLMLVVIALVYLTVKAATEASVVRQSYDQLDTGARVFRQVLDSRCRRLNDAVRVLAADFGFRDAVANGDVPTLRSVLANHGARVGAGDTYLLDLDGRLIASTVAAHSQGERLPTPTAAGNDGSCVVAGAGLPLLRVTVPVRAPLPIAQVVMTFAMDQAMAEEFRSLINLDVVFLGGASAMASTLPSEQGRLLVQATAGPPTVGDTWQVTLAGHLYQVKRLTLGASDSPVYIYLLRSLDVALAEFEPLLRQLGLIAGGALLAALLGALWLARNLAQPLRQLAVVSWRIGQGDYSVQVDVQRRDEFGRLARMIEGMREGIADREQRLNHSALHDPLTGLPNRILAEERLRVFMATQSQVSLLYVGLDGFQAINETAGVAGGDQILKVVAERAQVLLAGRGCVSRPVGDEFLVQVCRMSFEGAVGLADEWRLLLSEPILWEGQVFRLRCRVGVAEYPRHGEDPTVLIERARGAMLDAGQLPDRLRVYDEGRDAAQQRRLQLVHDLPLAGERGELMLVFQPKVALRAGGVPQAEVLLRWRHAELGMISPGEFIPLAERSGSMSGLTRWVIQAAIRQLALWQAEGREVKVSLNVSAVDLADNQLPERVIRWLDEAGVSARQLTFEITESAIMADPEAAIALLKRLSSLGIRLSVDDYGTGQASLAHLKRLPVDELKIDQSFIRELEPGNDDAVIVRSTIEMGHNLGLEVVAEGVEEGRTLALLRSWGCDVIQGYYISRPVPAGEFAAWMERQAEPAVEELS